MKDRAFSGRDVDEALEAAARALGLPREALRYVILETGVPARVGLGATPARIAVLLDGPPPAGEDGDEEEEYEEEPPDSDARAGLTRVVGSIVEAARLDVRVEVEDGEKAVVVRLAGPDSAFFYGEDGEVLRATEHLLQRMFARKAAPRRVGLECEGYRERRDEALRHEAKALADAVRKSGLPKTTRPLNSYERRVIHLALTGVAGIETFSVGEGEARRVTVAPRPEEPPGGGEAA